MRNFKSTSSSAVALGTRAPSAAWSIDRVAYLGWLGCVLLSVTA